MQGTIRHLYDPTFVPVLGQPGWSGRHLFACRPLVADSPDAPLVAYGWLDPGGARLLGRDEAALRGWSDDDLESAAHASLGRRSNPDFRPLWLGVVPALAYDGDEHAAAQLLRRSVRVDLQRRLRSRRVLVGIPHRGAIVACDAETAGDADLAGLVQVGFEAARAAGLGPVCPHLLVLEQGELTGVLSPQAERQNERPTERIARRIVPKLTKSGGLVLRAGCRSEESLVDAFGRELEGIARAVEKKGGFKGVVRVKVDPEAFPSAKTRPMRVAAVEQLFRELAANKGLRAPNGQRVRVRVLVGAEDPRAEAEQETSRSEVSRSSSTMAPSRRRSSLLRQAVAGRSRRLRRRTG
jgi:hypothetical protein